MGSLKKVRFLNFSCKKFFNQRWKNKWLSFVLFNEKKIISVFLKKFSPKNPPRCYSPPPKKKRWVFRKSFIIQLIFKNEKNFIRIPKNVKKKTFSSAKNFYLKRISPDNSLLVIKRKIKQEALRSFFLFPFFTQMDELWNDLVHFIIVIGKNFSKKNSQYKLFGFMTLLAKSLWVMDCQYGKFLERKNHGGHITTPPFFFMSFFAQKSYRCLWEEISHLEIAIFPLKKNKILKEIELRRLSFYLRIISRNQKSLEIFKLNKSELVYSLNSLSFSFQTYAEYNRLSLERIEKNHLRNFPRNVDKFTFFKTVEPSKKKNRFSDEFCSSSALFRRFNRLKNYQPFDISSYLPHNKQKRGKVLENLPFPFPVEILEFIPGSNKKKIVVCWKIPFDKNQRNLYLTNSITKKEKEKFPLYYSRNMLKFQKINKYMNINLLIFIGLKYMFFLWLKFGNFKLNSKQSFSKRSEKGRVENRNFSQNVSNQCAFLRGIMDRKKQTSFTMKSTLCFSDIFKEKNIEFKWKGNSLVISCPFHKEKTPSFYANEEKGVFFCFGCGVSGNIHTFIKNLENENFKGNFSERTNRSKLSIKFLGNGKNKSFVKKPKSSKLVNFEGISSIQIAWIFYKQFFKNDQKIKILCFLRGFSYMSNQIFGVGFAPGIKNPVFRIFRKKQISIESVIESGLVRSKNLLKAQKLVEKKEPLYYFDMFKERIIIPIHNQKGVVVAFGGRTIDKKNFPKYINSSDWEIFKKKRILFSQDILKSSHLNRPEITILVEGYLDSFTLFQNGIRFSVANLGIGICSYQLLKSVISNKNSHLLFFLDSDFSGKKAVQNFFWKFKDLFTSNLFRLSVSEIPEYIHMKDPDEFSYFEGSFSLTNKILNKSAPALFWIEKLVFEEGVTSMGPLESKLNKISKNFHWLDSTSIIFKKFYLNLNTCSEKWENQVKSLFLKKQKKIESLAKNQQKKKVGVNFFKFKNSYQIHEFTNQTPSKKYTVSLQKNILFVSLYYCKVRNDISQVCIPNKFYFSNSFIYHSQQMLASYLFEINLESESKIFIKFLNMKNFFHLNEERLIGLIEKKYGVGNYGNLKVRSEWIDVFLTKLAIKFFEKEKKICSERYKKIIFIKNSLVNYPFIYPETPNKNHEYFSTLDFMEKRKKSSLKHFSEFSSELKTK